MYFSSRLLAALEREELHKRLIEAVGKSDLAGVSAALQAGANVNDDEDGPNWTGQTPLLLVSMVKKSPETVQIAQTLLRQPGIDVNKVSMLVKKELTPTGQVAKAMSRDPYALQLARMFIAAGGRATEAEVRNLPPADREQYLALVREIEAQDSPPAYQEAMAGRAAMAEEEEKEAAQAAGVGAPGGPGWRPEAMLAEPARGREEAAGEVSCPACTFSNKPGAAKCAVCDTPFMAGRR
jgi:hypothetical protein